jgi:Fibronectin type III domain
MKKATILSLIVGFIGISMLSAQNQTFNLGKSQSLKDKFSASASKRESKRRPTSITIAIGGGIKEVILLSKNVEELSKSSFWGTSALDFEKKVFFSFDENGTRGEILDYAHQTAVVFGSNDIGEVIAEHKLITEVVCTDYAGHAEEEEETRARPEQRFGKPLDPTPAVNKLQSLPGAAAVLYLDLDGETVTNSRWNNGNKIIAKSPGTSDANIRLIWQLVSEDYIQFQLNVTTDLAVFKAAAPGKRMQVIFTPDDLWYNDGKAGGVAMINSFSWKTGEAPCWVFNGGTKTAAETASHEAGHTLGLSHDATATVSYYDGHADWAPIMGSSYTKAMSHWSIGEYTGANNKQDDLAIISGTKFGFGYKTDDHGNAIANATALLIETNGAIDPLKNDGLIEKRTDLDYFKFTTTGGQVKITAKPAAYSPNLNIQLKLLNSSGTVLQTSNATTTLQGTIDFSATSGTYYIEIDGVGQKNPLNDGYSDYSSIGYFSLSGTIPGNSNTDCAGVAGGTAYLDNCQICVGGNTGKTACIKPIAVSNLTLSPTGCTSVKLSWKDNSNNETGFIIERRETGLANTLTTLITTAANVITYVDNTVKETKTYEYKVKSNNVAGFTDMAFVSVSVPGCNYDCNKVPNGTATLDLCGICTGGNTGLTACTKPIAPTNVSISKQDCKSIVVVWTDKSTNEDGFELQRRVVGTTIVTAVDNVAENALTATDNQLEVSKTYEYRVVASNEAGASPSAWVNSSAIIACQFDCANVQDGKAVLDQCGICTGGTTGRVACEILEEGYYTIKAVNSNKCLYKSANSVLQTTCVPNSADQIWQVQTFGSDHAFLSLDGNNSMQYLTTDVSTKITYGDPNTYSDNERYNLEPLGAGVYKIIPVLDIEKVFNIANNSTANDGVVILWTRSGQKNEQFTFTKVNIVEDCNGDANGSASIDACGICSGGKTGIVPKNDPSACINGVETNFGIDQSFATPNPFSTKIILSKARNWAMFDSNGNLLSTGTGQEIETVSLVPGFYIISLENGQKIKMVKQPE